VNCQGILQCVESGHPVKKDVVEKSLNKEDAVKEMVYFCNAAVIIYLLFLDCVTLTHDRSFTACGLTSIILRVLQALKMSYFSNKPAPTPGSMLPQPVLLTAVVNEPLEKRSLKRKQSASSESGLHFGIIVLIFLSYSTLFHCTSIHKTCTVFPLMVPWSGYAEFYGLFHQSYR